MNENRWLTSTDAYDLLNYLYPAAGLHSVPEMPRKLRLYYVALARKKAGLPPVGEGLLRIAEGECDGRPPPTHLSTRLYELAERVADSGGTDAAALVAGCELDLRAVGYDWPTDRPSVPDEWAREEWSSADGRPLLLAFLRQVPPVSQLTRHQHDTDVLREIFGNPFRPTPPAQAWRTAEVVGLARRCYDDRAFNSLTLLVDALQEAGCPPDHPLVAHCRDVPTAAHARGCWAVDALLGL